MTDDDKTQDPTTEPAAAAADEKAQPADESSSSSFPHAAAQEPADKREEEEEEEEAVTTTDRPTTSQDGKLIVYGGFGRGRPSRKNPLAESTGNVKYKQLVQEKSKQFFMAADGDARKTIMDDIIGQFEFREASTGKPSTDFDIGNRLCAQLRAGRQKNPWASREEETTPMPERRIRQATKRYTPQGGDDVQSMESGVMPKSPDRGKRKIKQVHSESSSPQPTLFGEEIMGRRVCVLFEEGDKEKLVPYTGHIDGYQVTLKRGRGRPPLGGHKGSTKTVVNGNRVERLFHVVFADGDKLWMDLSALKREDRMWFQDAS